MRSNEPTEASAVEANLLTALIIVAIAVSLAAWAAANALQAITALSHPG